MSKLIRLISDVHGKVEDYINVAKQVEYSIQLGDMGCYHFADVLDPDHHKFFGGNHEDYDFLEQNPIPHNLGDYGEFELNGIKGFFIRGAFSVDIKFRQQYEMNTGKRIWWSQEQLSYVQLTDAISKYIEVKPDLMLTHDFPDSWSKKNGSKKVLQSLGFDPKTFNTTTQQALQECFEAHKPKVWHGAHFHFNKNKVWHGTRFICRKELGWTDLDENLNTINSSNKNLDNDNF